MIWIGRRAVFVVVVVWMTGWAWSWFVPLETGPLQEGNGPIRFAAWWCLLGPILGLAAGVVLFFAAGVLYVIYDWAFPDATSEIVPVEIATRDQVASMRRELTLAAVKDEYATGRLTLEELEARLDAILEEERR